MSLTAGAVHSAAAESFLSEGPGIQLNHRLQQRRPDLFRVMVVIDNIYALKAVIIYVYQEG